MLKIAQGAEAIIYKDNETIIKERFSKEYRLAHLDQSLRQFRTRREAKVLGKLTELQFPAPQLHSFSDKRMSIVMDFIPGDKLKDVIEAGDDYLILAKEVGERIGKLHVNHIIHGDLTTSNMIVHKTNHAVHLIDFGLSIFSEKVEDKAVDLFLMERAVASTHSDKANDLFEGIIEGYRMTNPEAEAVLKRLEEVRQRGRNKKKED